MKHQEHVKKTTKYSHVKAALNFMRGFTTSTSFSARADPLHVTPSSKKTRELPQSHVAHMGSHVEATPQDLCSCIAQIAVPKQGYVPESS